MSGAFHFGEGGGETTARHLDIPYLGQVPLDPLVGRQADAGEPIVQAHPDAASSQALLRLASDVNSYFQSV